MSPNLPFLSRSSENCLRRRASRDNWHGAGAGAVAAGYMLLSDDDNDDDDGDEDGSEDVSSTKGCAERTHALQPPTQATLPATNSLFDSKVPADTTEATASPKPDRTQRLLCRGDPRANLAYDSQELLRSLSPARTYSVKRAAQEVVVEDGQGQETEPKEASKRAKKRRLSKRWSATAETWGRHVRGRVRSMVVSTAAAAAAAWRRDSETSCASVGEVRFPVRQQDEKKTERTRSSGYDLVDGESLHSVSEDDLTPQSEYWVGMKDDNHDDDEEEAAWPVRRRAILKGTCLEEWEAQIAEIRAQRLRDEQCMLSGVVAGAIQSALHQGRFNERQIDLRFAKCGDRLDDAYCMRKVSELFCEASALQQEKDHREWMQMMEKRRTQLRRWSQLAFWR
nr:hypothetical protein CFP56_22522 [Quercus suber]